MEEKFRDRSRSCQSATLQSTKNACVSKALEHLRKLQMLANSGNSNNSGSGGSGSGGMSTANTSSSSLTIGESSAGRSSMHDAIHGATHVVERLRDEIARITSSLETEQHVRAILQGKLNALDSHHQACINAHVAQERARCGQELDVINGKLQATQANHDAKEKDLGEKIRVCEQLTTELTNLTHKEESLSLQVQQETHTQADVDAQNTLLQSIIASISQQRDSLLKDLQDTLAQQSRLETSCAHMVTEAANHVERLHTQLASEIQIRLGLQVTVNNLQDAIDETAKPLPAASGLDLATPLYVVLL